MNVIPSAWRLPLGVIVVCGCLIGIISFGARAGFGLFLTPISTELQWGREVFALSLAIQNLIWGFGQPFAGMLADKYGSGRVLAMGGAVYALNRWHQRRQEAAIPQTPFVPELITA